MFLSIVTVFCDKDAQYIPTLLQMIEERIHVSHEVILIDNREKNKDQIDFKSAKVYSKGYNTYQFEARRYSVQFCSGDYIWFIDADDEPLEILSDLENNLRDDVIIFNYSEINDKGLIVLPPTWETKTEAVGKKRFLSLNKEGFDNITDNKNFWDYCCCPLWNKWLKRDFFERLITDISEDLIIVASEDILYSAISIDNADSICFCFDPIYIYRADRASSAKSTMCVEKFMHIIKGRKESRELFEKLTSNPKKYDDIACSATYFLLKAEETEDIDACVKEMTNHFTLEEIISGTTTDWYHWIEPNQNRRIQHALTTIIS